MRITDALCATGCARGWIRSKDSRYVYSRSSGIMCAGIDLSRCREACKHARRVPRRYSDNADNNLPRQEMGGTLITTCPAYSMSALFYCHDDRRSKNRSRRESPRKIFISTRISLPLSLSLTLMKIERENIYIERHESLARLRN